MSTTQERPQKPLGIGFIERSTQGWAAAGLARPLFHPLLVSKYSLIAVCTRSASTAATTASLYSSLAPERYSVKAYHGPEGIYALIADPQVDIVAVSVKIPDHFALVQQAIEAGKDVFVEWTPGSGYEETKKIEELAQAKGVRVVHTHGPEVGSVKSLAS